MGSYKQLTGMQTPIDRPDRVRPVPETYEGVTLPYRGTQTHGVSLPKDAHYDTREIEYKDDAKTPEYLPDPDASIGEPIPVRIVQGDAKRERLDWRVVRWFVTDQPQQILGRHDKRRSVLIRVHEFLADEVTANTNPIFIGNDSGLRPYTGFRIGAGRELDSIRTTEDIWAVTLPGAAAEISVMYEFGVEL